MDNALIGRDISVSCRPIIKKTAQINSSNKVERSVKQRWDEAQCLECWGWELVPKEIML